MTMTLTEFRTNIRLHLADTATFWSDAEVDRAVERAEFFLARLIPKKNIVETTITIDRASETITLSSSAGTTAYKPVKYDSETVTSKPVGTSYTRGTDYTFDYMTGILTEIGTQMADTDYLITYKQDTQRLDISSLVTNPVRITRVEYPVGELPPTYLGSFDLIEDYLILHKDDALTEGKHLRIYYDSAWTGAIVVPSVWTADTVIALDEVRRPTTANATGYYYKCTLRAGDFKTGGTEPTWGTTLGGTTVDDAITWTAISLSNANGEYPGHLADVIVTGASGFALLMKAEKYVQSAVAEIILTNAAADSMSTPLADINTALDKVATYLETNVANDSGVDNAKTLLTRITTDTAQLRTRIDAILSKANDFLFSADTDPSAKYYLTQGDDYIKTVNVADRVAEKYADYARATIQTYTGLVAEATMRLDVLRSYIEEGGAWMQMGEDFIAEATQRIAEVSAWAIQADRYVATTTEYLNIAGRYLASGQSKVNEFFVLIGVKPEIQHTRAASSQPTQY